MNVSETAGRVSKMESKHGNIISEPNFVKLFHLSQANRQQHRYDFRVQNCGCVIVFDTKKYALQLASSGVSWDILFFIY